MCATLRIIFTISENTLPFYYIQKSLKCQENRHFQPYLSLLYQYIKVTTGTHNGI